VANKFFTALAALGLTLVIGGTLQSASAQQSKPSDKEKGGTGSIMDPNTGKRLKAAVDAIQAQHYAEAESALGELNMDHLSPYERSRAEQLYAVAAQLQSHYSAAREHLKLAIASGGLNDQEASTARFQIAQLYMAENKWKEGAEALQEWFKTAQNPNSAAYHLLAVAYYQMGDHAAAVEPAQKAVDLGGARPQEGWMQLLLAIRLELKQYKQALPVVKRLIEAAPTNKNYWLQYAALESLMGDTSGAAVPIELAYRGDWLTGDENAKRLTQFLVQAGIPYRAAEVLSQAIEKGVVKSDIQANELLSNCWLAAKEYDKAIKPLKRAAELSSNGEIYYRLAQVYAQREDWPNTAEALRLAIDKGNLKNPGEAELLMGIATYNQKQIGVARSWFGKAKGYSESRAHADGWIAHIDDEQRAAEQRVSEPKVVAPKASQ
jgi:tetratricopeptide (TPR) repeat protein